VVLEEEDSPEHHTNLLLIDLNALDECPMVSRRVSQSLVQPVFDACGKLIKSTQISVSSRSRLASS